MVETTRHDFALPGCTPEPLMAYLKALGVLRLVSEQKDAGARGWWKNDIFWLRSTLTMDALVAFFLRDYKPTPLVAPWNAGSGFYSKWDEEKEAFKNREANKAVSDIASSVAARFQPFRDQLGVIKKALKQRSRPVSPADEIAEVRNQGRREGWSKKTTDEEVKKLLDGLMLLSAAGSTLAIEKVDKDDLVCYTRNSLLNDDAIRWIDAAFVIRTGQKKNRTEAPLLGSGGNIGNSDFTARFMQILASCLPLQDGDGPSDESAQLLKAALLGGATAGLASLAVDQFDPGRAGGANMHQGMEGGFLLNPWDYILMVEGAVVFQGGSSKRLGMATSGSAFPFVVDSTSGGFTSAGHDTTRCEQWLPLWHRSCTASEIATLLAEGRSEVGRRQARTGVDFARAAASLGVDRGISQFVRVQYQARLGDNYLANALGRVDALPRESVDLLEAVDPWLNAFRRAAGDKNAPPRFATALLRIDSAVFDFCKYGGAPLFQEILIALGAAERVLATGDRFREKMKLRPLADLPAAWIEAADDGSVEFAAARALASIHDPETKVGPLRANLEPVDWKKRCRGWAEKDRAIVWNAADLGANLEGVLQRRLMDGTRAGCERLPLASRFQVPLDAVAAFLAGELDDQRIEDLIWGLMLSKGARTTSRDHARADHASVPRAYALLKLLFLPRPLVIERDADGTPFGRLLRGNEQGGVVIRPEPSVLHLLRGGAAW